MTRQRQSWLNSRLPGANRLLRQARQATLQTTVDPSAYPTDPVGYAKDVLKIPFIWEKQAEIAESLLKPPYKTLVKSGHNIGKTFLAAWLVNWWYDSFNPCGVMSTAPTDSAVKRLLWKEIRTLRANAGLPNSFIGPSAAAMNTSQSHYAIGLVANQGESFQGSHDGKMFFIFDEAVGLRPIYYTATKSMHKPEPGYAWLVLCNPTDPTSQLYDEDQGGEDEEANWNSFSLSALDHPNIAAGLKGLRGRDLPVPNAVTCKQVDNWIADWSTRVRVEPELTDIEWPPKSGKWYRPGPEFESRVLGQWPSGGTYGVWSEALLKYCLETIKEFPIIDLPELGCDVARHGDDFTAFHARWGSCSYRHEAVNGWKITQTAGLLIEWARQAADMITQEWKTDRRGVVSPEQIPIKIDDDGVGGGVVDILQEQGFNAIPIRAGNVAMESRRYPNRRSELWFATARRAADDGLDLTRLDAATRKRVKSQAMAPRWKLDSLGRRVVEDKEETKKKIGRSPDDMDALNLAYYGGQQWEAPQFVDQPRERAGPERGGRGRKLFGG